MKQIKYIKLIVCFFAFLFAISLSIKPTNAIYRDTKSTTIKLSITDGGIICKKAITLHSEVCNTEKITDGCKAAGYAAGETLIYGSIINSDTLKPGDVFDCDVDGTGYNHRFYYLRTMDNKAVLIYYTNFEGENGPGTLNNYHYDVALTKLPTTTQWSNIPLTFEIQTGDYRPARFITREDLEVASGKTGLTDVGSFDNINFIFENTTYANATGHSTVWLKEEGSTRYRYHKNGRNLVAADANSNNAVRPVIEVPLSMIEDSYIIKLDANGGTVTTEYIKVIKGDPLGTLPTPTNGTYTFGGWYTDKNYTTEVDENTIPSDYNTYYAKWVLPVSEAQLAKNSLSLEEDEQESIVITNVNSLEPHTFTSSNSDIATVDENGLVTAINDGTCTITIIGTYSNTTKEVSITVTNTVEYKVMFDTQGGTPVDDMYVRKNKAIGTLPTTEKTDNDFMGWFTDNTNYTTEVTETTIIDTDNTTFYAKWIPTNAIAEMNGEYYTTVQAAIDDAPSTQTTINVLKDITLATNLASNTIWADLYNNNTSKNIILDLNDHTITYTGTNKVYIVRSKGTLEVRNGSMISKSDSAALESNGKTLTINNINVEAIGAKQAIYNEGGTIIIKGGTKAKSKTTGEWNNVARGTVQNNTGTMIILDAEIINTNGPGVSIGTGTVTIGTKDDKYNTTIIDIQGSTYGINSKTNYSLYDGMIKGVTAAVNNEDNIANIEDNATKVKDSEDGYNRLYYTLPVPTTINITLDPNGGEVSQTSVTINVGDEVGELPVPTKGIYTFDGWYTENDELVLSTRVPEDNETYHAVWSYDSSDDIVEHNIMPTAVRNYFNNISSWASGQTDDNHASFDTAMMNNFNSNNCKYFKNYDNRETEEGGSVYCDQPNEYDTGMVDPIKVYKSNTSKVKGDEATYVTVNNGKLYNMIPGEIYKWELVSDSNVYGYVKAIGERRFISIDNNTGINKMRNVRDLGGIKVDKDGDGTIDGTIKYGVLYRGERIYSGSATYLNKLGIQNELDLRSSSDHTSGSDDKLQNNITNGSSNSFEIKHYVIDYEDDLTYYNQARAALTKVMTEIVNTTDPNYAMFFHCRIGADRTGTLAYLIEGILGAPKEERYRDYELTMFYGFRDRTRFYSIKPGGEAPNDKKFKYLREIMTVEGKEDVYAWYMKGSTDVNADNTLIQAFKDKMIESL